MEVLRAGHREPRGVSADRPPRRLQARLASSERVRPIAPSLSFQVQLRCSVTVTEPGSWRPPPPSRQQRLPPRRMRLSRGTYLAKCAPGLSCMDFLLVVHPEREKPREQLASSRIPGAQSTNAAQASSPPSPIPPCFSPPFHLPNARRRRAELQQQVQKVLRGVCCLSLRLTFLRPRPLRLLRSTPATHRPRRKMSPKESVQVDLPGRRASLVEQREASSARLRRFGEGEERGDRCLASASLGPGSTRAWEKRETEREAGKEGKLRGATAWCSQQHMPLTLIAVLGIVTNSQPDEPFRGGLKTGPKLFKEVSFSVIG
ncbi:uncharacterized protein [Manis javanica]|uniref:uncharacterized protein n=1 Tax=Manis javanica TaxID=9974 RepID=UPI003C6CC6E0